MTGEISAVRERLIFGFNSFYSDFLADVAKSDDTIKKRLKKHYRVINRKSDSYLLEFYNSAKKNNTLSILFTDFSEEDEKVCDLFVAKGLKYGELTQDLLAHVRILGAIAWMFGELCDIAEEKVNNEEENPEGEDDDSFSAAQAVNDMFERFMESVAGVQMGRSWGSAIEGLVDEEAKDIFKCVLTTLTHHNKTVESDNSLSEPLSDSDKDTMMNAFDMMKCSKLGNIVQEISDSIDKTQLKEAVESGNLGTDNMDMMGNLFKQVSGAITSKLQSGEISNEDLISETMSLMNSVKGIM
ncbi:hypothetical protein TetV_172 [Tetraselmis virus 1]|uniref:Uncharacterized protein n=1 Tax=Tetraselmis virus 1 TaxID=2060617 RepID=A0A2P0VMY4_9VIRU|nr:hypothetical protein QJ968_gp172 [Tetraselmis virus 1]AUF82264.1 hypothetical protein TetV_172 [Tetraselmis virus 1]